MKRRTLRAEARKNKIDFVPNYQRPVTRVPFVPAKNKYSPFNQVETETVE